MLLYAFITLAALSGFEINDTTDNDTGKRTVYAFQLSEGDDISSIWLECRDGIPAVRLDIDNFTPRDWEVGLIESDHNEGPIPLVFQKLPNRNHLILFNPTNEFFDGFGPHDKLGLTLFGSYKKYTTTYSMTGAEAAWERVASACKPT